MALEANSSDQEDTSMAEPMRLQTASETSIGNSSWTEVGDDDLASLLSSLSRLESEKRQLCVQLEAAQEALFTHQNKTRNLIDSLEEEIGQLKESLASGKEREGASRRRISELEDALEDMQLDKQTLQKRCSSEAEAAVRTESNLREEAEKEVQRLSRDLELKTEENIGMRMTILKIQEDLSKENHLQEKTIEERDRTIQQLKKTLSEIRLENDARTMSELLTPESEGEEEVQKPHELPQILPATELGSESESSEAIRPEPGGKVSPLEEGEDEITHLRKENNRLRSQLRKLQSQLQEENETQITLADIGPPKLKECPSIEDDEGQEDEEEMKGWTTQDGRLQDQQQQCERLRRALRETQDSAKLAQDRADHVTYLLNQKLIELNKLQLTLSSQTKEMIQLEKAYFQLRSHLGHGFRSPSRRPSRLDVTTNSSC